jgi:glutaredoxin 3
MRARKLLKSKGIAYEELRVDSDKKLRKEMERRSRRTSVPQIFIGATHVGGYDDLAILNRKGELEALLEQESE